MIDRPVAGDQGQDDSPQTHSSQPRSIQPRSTEAQSTQDRSSDENWLRTARLEELFRIARLCGIDFDQFPIDKRNLSRDDLITVIHASRESDLTDAKFRELIRPANSFEVQSAREDGEAQLEEARRSLQSEIEPLKEVSQRIKIWAAIVLGVAGILGSFLLNSVLGIGELEDSMEQRLTAATEKLKNTGQEVDDSASKVNELEQRLDRELKKATEANKDFQKMIVALSTHTGIQMIGKLNTRLDRLRSMRVYHLKPLMDELALEIESDTRTLQNLQALLGDNHNGSDEHALLNSLRLLSEAIRDLRLIYDERDKIDLDRLKQVREQWSPLRKNIGELEIRLHSLMRGNHETEDARREIEDSKNLLRLRANVFQMQAGLAIQQYRDDAESRTSDTLLEFAYKKCESAILENDLAPTSYLYKGLISSLRISRFLEQIEDPNERVQRVEREMNWGAESYTRAARYATTPEQRVYALNGKAYLFVKVSNIYIDAANHPMFAKERQRQYQDDAVRLLTQARQEIQGAETSAGVIDPIVLTTQADIEILDLRFRDPEQPEKKYDEILGLLGSAVEYGYTGYSGTRDSFFEKRPHFHYLKKLSKDYEQDVWQAIRYNRYPR